MNIVMPQMDLQDRGVSLVGALFKPMGVDGVYARTDLYERVVDGLAAFITRHREPETEVLRFPPVMSRQILEKSSYLRSFPQLLGCVSCLQGGETEIRSVIDASGPGGEWLDALAPADLVLSPASCYPIYPLAAQRGAVPIGGLLFDVAAECFRREPSRDLDRLQSFRMREYVCIGTPEQVQAFRKRWMMRAPEIVAQLGLQCRLDQASDPFFGRGGLLIARAQIEQSLKFELLIPVRSVEKPTACMSFNYHRDHFGSVWGLQDKTGDISHTACVAFGMDRLALAMFVAHGVELAKWPNSVLMALHL
jgi:seryl-tRNA synthetase